MATRPAIYCGVPGFRGGIGRRGAESGILVRKAGGSNMKILLLVRHAKSSWNDPSLADRERPLNARGKRDAPWIGEFLKRHGLVPDLVLSSPAVRACKTARKLATAAGLDQRRIELRQEIYDGGTEELRQLAAGLGPELNCVALVGHNPVLTEFVNGLIHSRIDSIPTAGIVAVRCAAEDWAWVRDRNGQLLLFARPPAAA